MTMSELPDPSPHISQMSQGQLRTLVEELVSNHNRNVDQLSHGQQETRPSWWPPDVPWINPQIRTRRHSQQQVWSEGLRRVVRSCYKHHGQEHRLEEPINGSIQSNNDDLLVTTIADNPSDGVNNNNENNCEAEMPVLKKSQLPDVVPTSGPIPSDSFSRWETGVIANMAALPEATGAVTSNKELREDKPFVEIFICFFCEKEFESRDHLQCHQENCDERSLLKPIKPRRIVQRAARSSWRCKPTHPDAYMRTDHKAFVEAMGLIPCSKLDTLQKRKNKDKEEIKFEVIEIDDCPILKTPNTPRSAKSLISQLSRDLSPPPSTSRLRRMTLENSDDHFDLLPYGIKLECKDEDEESTCSNKSDMVEAEFNMRKIPSLLAIDLCSVLGQRVKKHVDKLDSSERTPYEEFCHTPVKNNALDRLRNRPAGFPITFRKTKRLCPPQCHWYKFTKKDRQEFIRIVRTGLTKRARQLKRMMVPCKVTLDKMKECDIIRWTTPKKHQQIRSMYTAYQQSWQYVAHQDGQRVLSNAFPPTNSMYNQQHQDAQKFNHLMCMGQQLGLPPGVFNSGMRGPSPVGGPQLNRAYKAVLSGHTQPCHPTQRENMQRLNIYQLPLSCPSKGRNFGNALQPGGFYGPNPARSQPLSSNKSFHRPNILSKENGSLHCNRTVRRLSMDSPAKTSELTANNLQQLPSSVLQKKPEDDVISISSTESESEMITVQPPLAASLKRPMSEDRNNNSASQRRLSGGAVGATQVVLFRCHLCQAEITCKIGQTDFIQKHFQERHAVNNIHLLEHIDANNQKVVTIVEDSGARVVSRPRPTHGQELNRSSAGRLGSSSGQTKTMYDRGVLKDIHHRHSAMGPGFMKGRHRHLLRSGEQEGHPHRTNGVDSGPEEIIILD